ncbi:PucR family transcriptional regulator [Streptomyces iranensis]|uniref:Uncharacterized protein n=1 Tax=Streptomyces iranensis TaxID=576784 RepID=A0A060ZRD7_9ACTN|nr:helix-turn-helix domain-containing protein [Streptomyces iranensis]MBP2061146.1 hypothetical protein [Streptomyces iranensis]CDR05587.1 predicted protein [Streptomyces iranensis]
MHTQSAEVPPPPELRELVGWCLGNMETLAQGYLDQLRAIEGYTHVDIPEDDLHDTTTEALELILRKVAGLPVSTHLETVSESIGRRRAVQGVPLEVLLQAVRMVFRLLWTTLRGQADTAQRNALNDSAVRLWEAIEYHTVRVHAGYLNEVSQMARNRETHIAVMLSGFLDRERPGPALTMQLSHTLGLPGESPYLVMAAPLTAMSDVRHRIANAGSRAQVHARADSAVILVPNPRPQRLLPHWAEGLPVTIAPVAPRLADVPGAWRLAHDLFVTAAPRGPLPLTLSEGWPALVAASLPELTAAIRSDALGGMGVLSETGRGQLFQTVETYLRSGSLSGTAEALVCHRNTVLKRLSRFKDLTGLDPATPWDAATVRIALAAPDGYQDQGEAGE